MLQAGQAWTFFLNPCLQSYPDFFKITPSEGEAGKENPMNIYHEFKEKRRKEINELPIIFAFSDEQLEEGLKKKGLEPSELTFIGNSGYIETKELPLFLETLERHKTELEEALKNEDFVFQMFREELANHEYSYTGDVRETLESLGFTFEEVQASPILKEGLQKALATLEEG